MIVGHGRQMHYFERLLRRGSIAHAYLFFGPEAVGKRTLALAIARVVLCERGSALGAPCPCESCRLAAAGQHPDFIQLSRDAPLIVEESKRELGIANIRELERLLALSPWRGGARAVVIDGADALSAEAQSALLKTLEEPTGRTIFFLVTAVPDALLPTIRSRAVPISFTTVADSELAAFPADINAGERREVILLANGRPGLLLRMLGDAKFRRAYTAKAAEQERLLKKNLREQFAFSERESREPGALESLLDFLVERVARELPSRLNDRKQILDSAATLDLLLARRASLAAAPVNRRIVADSVFFALSLASDAAIA